MRTCGALVAVEIYATINDFKAQRSTQQKKRGGNSIQNSPNLPESQLLPKTADRSERLARPA